MSDAVIVEAIRTPIGRRNGGLAGVHPVDLSAAMLIALVERTGVDPAEVDDVVWGCVSQCGDQAGNISRTAILAAGWPESVPGTTVNRACGSSQQALHFAAAGVVAGHYDLAVAGGVESMSRVPMGSARAGGDLYPPSVLGRYAIAEFSQGTGAEMMADKWSLSRSELDEFALLSHARAAAATDSGAMADRVVPIADVTVDEGVRRNGTVESLSKLKTVFREDGVIHAGNASQIADGAGALLVATEESAKARGLTPLVRVRSAVLSAEDPVMMLSAPINATARALSRAGLTIDDIGAFEVNEAFAPVPLAWLAETGADPERMNPWGGAIAVGHPLGASGAILMTRLIGYMLSHGIQYGLQTMCEAGGMSNATIVEAL
jgi:acetyl-CoA acyltransferase